VDAINSGKFTDQLTIREGIEEKTVFGEHTIVERQIPDNYKAVLDHRNASKTSVRRPKDYPVLKERFTQ